MSALRDLLAREAEMPAPEPVRAFAEALAAPSDVEALLFYGSTLRTGDLGGVLDFYVLTSGPRHRGARGWIERRLWPEIRFEPHATPAGELHAKVAVMPIAVFARAAAGGLLDTTIWTRFVQPSRIAWARDARARSAVLDALAAAACTASRFAAALGPERGAAREYWSALFRATYAAELRVERPGRETQVLDADPARWDALLPLAWAEAGVPFDVDDGRLAPRPSREEAVRWKLAWARRRRWGRPLNAARLAKAALTATGAVRYAAGKLSRHTDLDLAVTPWRERHPLLAALSVLWRLRRRRQADAR